MENKTFLKQAHVTGKWWDLNQETSSPGSSLWAHREDPQAEPAWSLACAPCSRLYSRETEALARLLSWWASLLLVNSLWRSHRWPREAGAAERQALNQGFTGVIPGPAASEASVSNLNCLVWVWKRRNSTRIGNFPDFTSSSVVLWGVWEPRLRANGVTTEGSR